MELGLLIGAVLTVGAIAVARVRHTMRKHSKREWQRYEAFRFRRNRLYGAG